MGGGKSQPQQPSPSEHQSLREQPGAYLSNTSAPSALSEFTLGYLPQNVAQQYPSYVALPNRSFKLTIKNSTSKVWTACFLLGAYCFKHTHQTIQPNTAWEQTWFIKVGDEGDVRLFIQLGDACNCNANTDECLSCLEVKFTAKPVTDGRNLLIKIEETNEAYLCFYMKETTARSTLKKPHSSNPDDPAEIERIKECLAKCISDNDIMTVTDLDELKADELQKLFDALDGLTRREIENAEKATDTHDVALRARAVLRQWRQIRGEDATRQAIISALQTCRLIEASQKLERMWSSQVKD